MASTQGGGNEKANIGQPGGIGGINGGGRMASVQWINAGTVIDSFSYAYYSRAYDLSAFHVMSADVHVVSITGTSLVVSFEHSTLPDATDGGYWLTSKATGSISAAGHTTLQLNEWVTATEIIGLMRMKIAFTSITALTIIVNSFLH